MFAGIPLSATGVVSAYSENPFAVNEGNELLVTGDESHVQPVDVPWAVDAGQAAWNRLPVVAPGIETVIDVAKSKPCGSNE